MYVTDSIRIFYLFYFTLVCLFFIWFISKVKRPTRVSIEIEEKKTGMDKREKRFLFGIVVVVIIANIVTISDIVPWQRWRVWAKPIPVKTYNIEISDYQFKFPEQPLVFQKNQFVEFNIKTSDVTYGFGVFRKDKTLVFQMQVLPGYENKFVWNFSETGDYDVRSTEYSGSRHSEMLVYDAIKVID